MLPWTDRSGNFAALRAVVFVLVLAPAAWIAVEASQGWLGSRATTEAIHQAGLWAIRLLAVAMAVTPLRVASRNAKLIGVRRMLGLAVLGYAFLHFVLYLYDENFAAGRIAWEILTRIYLLIGFLGLLGLVALGATSSDGMVRRLGAVRWTALHRLVYAVVALGAVHFFMQSKLDETQPLILAGIFVRLGLARSVRRWRGDLTYFATVLIAVARGGAHRHRRGGLVRAEDGRSLRHDPRRELRLHLHDPPGLVRAGGRRGACGGAGDKAVLRQKAAGGGSATDTTAAHPAPTS